MSDLLTSLDDDEQRLPGSIRVVDVVRRGVAATPSVRRPLAYGMLMALLVAAGRLAIPVLVQQVLDRGVLAEGYRSGVVVEAVLIALAVVVGTSVLAPVTEIMLATSAQQSLYELRRKAFDHIHRLGLVAHATERRGALLARVTSDVEAISRFVEWGAVAWAVNSVLIIGAFAIMALYSWQLALVALAIMLTVYPILRWAQRRQTLAYDTARTRVGEVLGAFDESIAGSATIRVYGYEPAARERIDRALRRRYRADVHAARYQAVVYTAADVIGAVALAVTAWVAITWGPGWGLGVGELVSFFFLIRLLQDPIAELTEIFDQTQRAVAGWNKVLTLLEIEPELDEPSDGATLPHGPLSVELIEVHAGYGDTPVLHDVSFSIAPGSRVAVVGETGSGKTTCARLLCRLLDPDRGEVRLGGVDLRIVDPGERHRAVRLVPQDGFLFDTTICENVRAGRPGASRADAVAAVSALGLDDWIDALPDGIDTEVAPGGSRLSVGERQLVALIRAQVSDPGLLVLDEATSSVDPRTEQALARALERLSGGRTVVSVAHRLSTAEVADVVLVFDCGRLVEQGHHRDLIAAGGRYAALHRAWRDTVGQAAASPPGAPGRR